MTISNGTQINFTQANTQKSQQASTTAAQESTGSIDRATFSEAAKKLAQENQTVHSQSGASSTWSQSASSNMQQSQNASTTSTSSDLQTMLMKNILSAYNTSQSQSSMSLMA
jgi:hypothetical protein